MAELLYPTTLYLVKDRDGKPHWYDKDPFRKNSKELKECEINLEDKLFSYFGTGSIFNPLEIRIGGNLLSRCEKFNELTLSKILREESEKHIEDVCGETVEVMKQKNNDESYPINGVVFDKNGKIICYRTYSMKGECSDRRPEHQLIIVNKVVKNVSVSKTETEDKGISKSVGRK